VCSSSRDVLMRCERKAVWGHKGPGAGSEEARMEPDSIHHKGTYNGTMRAVYMTCFFIENTLVSMETGEAVVLRGDDAGSCSQVQLSVDGALYSVIASERSVCVRGRIRQHQLICT